MVTVVPPAIGPVAGVMELTTGTRALVVNSTAFESVSTPPTVTTPTSTMPADVAAVTNLTVVLEITENETVVLPTFTCVVVARSVPVKVTIVPPLVVANTGELVLKEGPETYVIAFESVKGPT
jgi:hypothetical protein